MFHELFDGNSCPDDLRSQEGRRNFFMVGDHQWRLFGMLEDDVTAGPTGDLVAEFAENLDGFMAGDIGEPLHPSAATFRCLALGASRF